MPIVSSAIVPNSPLLLPKLSTVVIKKTAKTREALKLWTHELYARQPSIIVMVAYGEARLSICSLLQAPKLPYSFAEQGDVVTQGVVSIATGFTHSLKEKAEVTFPILLRSLQKLPINLAMPCWYLQQVFKEPHFIFLELPKTINLDELNKLSDILKEYFSSSIERIALIAVGNLAEQINKRKDEAIIFDKYFQSALQPLNSQALANLDYDLKKRIKETIWAPATLVTKVLDDFKIESIIMSYEAPAKAGYLVAQFNII